MTISIASGKGGTGKTTIATSLALAVADQAKDDKTVNVRLIDVDVEEPNSALFLNPEYTDQTDHNMLVPRVKEDKCTSCGICVKTCAYGALALLKDQLLVFDKMCHSCGACLIACPEDALFEEPRPIGRINRGRSGNLAFTEGRLNTGEALAPPIVRGLKDEINSEEISILDAPPGTSCSMVAAIRKSDYALLVTEDSPFGLHDLELAVDVVRDLEVPFSVFINREEEENQQVRPWCEQRNIDVIGALPYSEDVARAYSRGEPVVEALPEYRKLFLDVFHDINKRIAAPGQRGGIS
ncbi:MAG: ATP-binding protein [Spirochaetales bacterium]|nr:ATP-binding protein [Spirochaetales bacterium]MCF7937160.1 ATP-binding protein [Spirochaetales bacterium]